MKRLNVSVLFLACLSMFVMKSSVQQNENLYRGSDHRYANFLQHPRVFLDVSPMAIKKVLDSLYCALHCLQNARCLSFNFKVKPDADTKHECQLLDTDKYNSTDNLKFIKEFNHHSILTPCEASPCRNGGICHPVYDKQSYKCVCVAGFAGTNCQKGVSFCEEKKDGSYPDPGDCASFITCSNGMMYKKSCPPGLKYNAKIGVCDWPRNVECPQDS